MIGEQLLVTFCDDDIRNLGCSEVDHHPEDLHAELAVGWQKAGDGWAGLQRHPDDLAVVGLEKCHPQVCPESQCPLCNE